MNERVLVSTTRDTYDDQKEDNLMVEKNAANEIIKLYFKWCTIYSNGTFCSIFPCEIMETVIDNGHKTIITMFR